MNGNISRLKRAYEEASRKIDELLFTTVKLANIALEEGDVKVYQNLVFASERLQEIDQQIFIAGAYLK